MESLYRVVNKTDYEKALETGFVPRCNSDERANLVHLNIKQSVEIVASTYFDVSEFPVVLEVNPSSFSQAISWHEPTKANLGKRLAPPFKISQCKVFVRFTNWLTSSMEKMLNLN